MLPLADGTVYSKRKNCCPFSTSPVEAYISVLGEEKMQRLETVAQHLNGLKLLEVNATTQGGGVAEMLYSSIPFLNALGIEAEWKVISGSKDFFECTKSLHNQLQGMTGSFALDMEQTYFSNLEQCARASFIDNSPDVVIVHDPQPLGLIRYLRDSGGTWLWRCHIDMQEAALRADSSLRDFITDCIAHYDAAIFSAPQYATQFWPLPNFIISPFIDPLSEKNREMTEEEIGRVLAKYEIDPKIPIIAQIGRFDRWKGIERTIATYHLVRKERQCQLVLAGGLAADDPEGAGILARIYDETEDDEDIYILNLSLANRLQNCREINALQRAASVVMQPSTREGFGLAITEALWKGKPVIAANVGGIPLQVRDGDTGYFYETPHQSAKQVTYLLENPQAAEMIGKRGRRYVGEHFLLPHRITDFLIAIDMAVSSTQGQKIPAGSTINCHPPVQAKQTKTNPATGILIGDSNQGQRPIEYAKSKPYPSHTEASWRDSECVPTAKGHGHKRRTTGS
jgi:trehalose synthase